MIETVRSTSRTRQDMVPVIFTLQYSKQKYGNILSIHYNFEGFFQDKKYTNSQTPK